MLQLPQDTSVTSSSVEPVLSGAAAKEVALAESSAALIGDGSGLDASGEPEMTESMHQERMAESLARFWAEQAYEMDSLEIGTEQDFKNHNDLPLARIKRIMKSDEDVRMISAEAPVLFAKACEMFILELTLRSWCFSERAKRRTLQKDDIDHAIHDTPIFDFLVDLHN